MRKANTTWPASSSGRQSVRAADRSEHPRRRRAARRCPPRACIPTAIRWRASCCSKSPAYGPRRCSPKWAQPWRCAARGPSQLSEAHPRAWLKAGLLRGAAHITGGGITDNTPRMLPEGLAAAIDTSAWKMPPIFEMLRSIGNIPRRRLPAHLQSGRRHDPGRACAAPAGAAEAILAQDWARPSFRIGTVVAATPRTAARGVPVKRLGILLSGRGSNFEAIADNIAPDPSTPRSRS